MCQWLNLYNTRGSKLWRIASYVLVWFNLRKSNDTKQVVQDHLTDIPIGDISTFERVIIKIRSTEGFRPMTLWGSVRKIFKPAISNFELMAQEPGEVQKGYLKGIFKFPFFFYATRGNEVSTAFLQDSEFIIFGDR